MRLDHIALWVEDPLASVAFYVDVVGLTAVRVAEFEAKEVLFPSVRISDDSIIDLVPKAAVPMIEAIPGAKGTAGHKVNHVCLAMSAVEFEALAVRLEVHGTPGGRHMENQFGARGIAPKAFYFKDLDGNVLEARHYE
jgi:catechol 2,3-dioxygenase-like lactoylglutathione lyase family enzyme